MSVEGFDRAVQHTRGSKARTATMTTNTRRNLSSQPQAASAAASVAPFVAAAAAWNTIQPHFGAAWVRREKVQ